MKKIYLSLLAFSLLGSAFSQKVSFTKEDVTRVRLPYQIGGIQAAKINNNLSKVTIFSEDFENWPLTGWTIASGPLSTVTNPNQKWHEYASGNGITGKSIGVSYVNSTDVHDEELISPSITIPTGNYRLEFDFMSSIYYHAITLGGAFDNGDIFITASTDGGNTWSNVIWQEDDVALLEASFSEGYKNYVVHRAYVNVTQFAGNDVKFKFTYSGQDAAEFLMDNVAVATIPEKDIKTVTQFLGTTGTNALDYYFVPKSQSSFPGFTSSIVAQNIGSTALTNVALNTTSGSYNETGTAISLALAAKDTLKVNTIFALPTAVGGSTLTLTGVVDGATDEVSANNITSAIVSRTENVYGRDNGLISGGVSNFANATAGFVIGNVMKFYNETKVTKIQIGVSGNQADAIGSSFQGLLYIENAAGELEYLGETDFVDLTASNMGTLVTIPFMDEFITIPAGSVVVACAAHQGGNGQIAFAMAQESIPQSMIGKGINDTEWSAFFETNAVIVRLVDDQSASVKVSDALQGVKIYPNPSTGVINVSNDLGLSNAIVVTDLTGKEVASKIASTSTSLDLGIFGTGVYFVSVENASGRTVERVIVK